MPPSGRASPSPVMLILGSDSFRAETALEQALAAAVGEDRADSVESFRGDEASWARVLDVARTPSLFAPRRAVLVRGAEALKGDGAEALAYLDDPTPGTVLVLMAAKVDKRRNPWKALCDRAAVVAADPLKGRALRSHVAEALRARRLPMGEPAFDELLARVGQDLWRLHGELEKLAAFAQDRTSPLSAEDVTAVLGRGLAQPLYKIGDALAARRPAEAVALIEQALEEGEPAVLILSALHRSLRAMRTAKALAQRPRPRDAVAAWLGNRAFLADETLARARGWREDELEKAVAVLYQADRRLKSSVDGRLVLAAAVTEACGSGSAGATTGPGR